MVEHVFFLMKYLVVRFEIVKNKNSFPETKKKMRNKNELMGKICLSYLHFPAGAFCYGENYLRYVALCAFYSSFFEKVFSEK